MKKLCMTMMMLLVLLLAAATAEGAAAYIDRDGREQSLTAACTPVREETTLWQGSDEGTWLIVDRNVTVSGRISVSKRVNLILADGCTLSAPKGISVREGCSLTIYGQWRGTGCLKAGEAADKNYAGIGGEDSFHNVGTITINGGTVTAHGGAHSAGIGGGGLSAGEGLAAGGFITINGGTVTAMGGWNGAGIGGGSRSSASVTINGGTVTATGGFEAAGIGSGFFASRRNRSRVTIAGGEIVAQGGFSGSGIGGGKQGVGGEVTISGGTVTATGGIYGSGIGGGEHGGGGVLQINGGVVVARGGSVAKQRTAAIGAGEYGSGSGTLTLNPTQGDEHTYILVRDGDTERIIDGYRSPTKNFADELSSRPSLMLGEVRLRPVSIEAEDMFVPCQGGQEITYDPDYISIQDGVNREEMTVLYGIPQDDDTLLWRAEGPADVGIYVVRLTHPAFSHGGMIFAPINRYAILVVTKAEREEPKAAQVLVRAESLSGACDGSLTPAQGVTGLEYRKQGERAYTALNGSRNNLPSGVYEVRFAEDATHEPSNPLAVTIGEGALRTITYTAKGYLGSYAENQVSGIEIAVTDPVDAAVTYSEDGMRYSAVCPAYTDAGEYTVYYRIEREHYAPVTGSECVRIEKAERAEPTPAQVNVLTGVSPYAYRTSGSGSLIPAEGVTGLEYRKQGEATYQTLPEGGVSLPSGIYEIRFAESENHRASAPLAVSVGQEELKTIVYSAQGYVGSYDGQAHSVSVTVHESAGAMVKYITDGGDYLADAPAYADAGSYEVRFRIEGRGYATVEGSVHVLIGLADTAVPSASQVLAAGESTAGAGDGSLAPADGITGLEYRKRGEEAFVPLDGEKPDLEAGVYEVRFSGNANHRPSACLSVAIGAGDLKTISFNVKGYTGGYRQDRTGGISVYDVEPADAAVSYSEDGRSFALRNPTYTDAGSYTVYYRIEKPGYTTVTGCSEVTIAKAGQDMPNVYVSGGMLMGTAEGMEYRLADEESYMGIASSGSIELAAGTYCVRFAEKRNYRASADALVVVEKGKETTYRILEGEEQSVTVGECRALIFRASGPLERFVGICMDGRPVDAPCYTVKAGSTIVTLKSDYVQTLAEGTHVLSIRYTDGQADVAFTVKKAVQLPQTGDSEGVVIWLTLCVVCAASALLLRHRKHV